VWGYDPFNSLSRDHQKFKRFILRWELTVLSTPSLGITGLHNRSGASDLAVSFQLPLSGSHHGEKYIEFDDDIPPELLSTPSLGITFDFEFREVAELLFQLPLSGSQKGSEARY
jgi:hypothetical protein